MVPDKSRLLVGASGKNSGAGYVYNYVWDAVTEQFVYDAVDDLDSVGGAGSGLGCGMAIAGERLAVGEYQYDGSLANQGRVLFYNYAIALASKVHFFINI